MARQTAWTPGEKITAARLNEGQSDYVSQSDPAAQSVEGDFTVKGDLTVNGSLAFGASGAVTGRYTPGNPIKVAHGLDAEPTHCTIGINAPQPYACGWTADATFLYFYPNTAAEVTISYHAW